MKTIITLAATIFAALTLTSCEKPNPAEQVLDPDAMISLRPASGVKAVTKNPAHLTANEIVEQATDIWFWNFDYTTQNALGRGFAESQRDLINMRLLMWGTDIIDQFGEYVGEFIESHDVVLTKQTSINSKDTIGYISNATLRAAEAEIKEAFAQGDYTTCYEVFDRAFTFEPITAAEWRELKARGEN